MALSADAWWMYVSKTFENILREYLKRAKKADLDETGHDCGHRWRITVESSGHYIGPDGTHNDANYWGPGVFGPVEVRAHNLRDGLLLAAAEPLSSWMIDDDLRLPGEDAPPSAETSPVDALERPSVPRGGDPGRDIPSVHIAPRRWTQGELDFEGKLWV
ncbi:MAG TPA: hypothetical protein VIY48_12495 [Candidatus Paceibacterota bacterium]